MYSHGTEVIIIRDDPNVFGDGNHESTQMVLEALYQQNPEGKTVLDIGTGTGIQSIFATKWCAKEVLAVDTNISCIYTARKNFQKNNVEITSRLNIYNEFIDKKFDITIANLPISNIIEYIPMAKNTMKDEGVLIFSWDKKFGIFEAHLEENGFEIVEHFEGIDWDAYVVELKG